MHVPLHQAYLSNTAFAIFYDADTDGDASVSLAARKAYLHMTLHTAIGGTGIYRVLFSWNDVLLAWM